MSSVSYGRPRRLLTHIDRWTPARRRIGFADSGDHSALWRGEETPVCLGGGSAAADDHVHCSLAGVDHVGGGRRGDRRQRGVCFTATDRGGALVMVLMSTDHEVDA